MLHNLKMAIVFNLVALIGKFPLAVACTSRLRKIAGTLTFSLWAKVPVCATDGHNLQWMNIPFIASNHFSGQVALKFHYILSESEVAQSCPTLCDPMDCSLWGSSFHGIFQARVLEWIAICFSRGPSWPRNRTQVSHIAGRHLTIWALE